MSQILQRFSSGTVQEHIGAMVSNASRAQAVQCVARKHGTVPVDSGVYSASIPHEGCDYGMVYAGDDTRSIVSFFTARCGTRDGIAYLMNDVMAVTESAEVNDDAFLAQIKDAHAKFAVNVAIRQGYHR